MPRHRYIEQAPRYLQVYTEGNNEGKVKDSPWSVGLEVVKGSSVKVDSPEYSQGEPGCLMPGPLHLTSEMLPLSHAWHAGACGAHFALQVEDSGKLSA